MVRSNIQIHTENNLQITYYHYTHHITNGTWRKWKWKRKQKNKNTIGFKNIQNHLTMNSNNTQTPNNNQVLEIIGINTLPHPNNQPQQNNKLKRTIQEDDKTSTSDNTNVKLINKKTKQNKFYEMQEKNRYDNNISGPFIVQITAKDESQNLGNLHPQQLGKKIAPLATQLQKINKLGKDKIQLTFNNHIYANEFIDKAKNKLTEWYTYIPDYKMYRRMVVYDIPKEMSVEEIEQGIEEHDSNPEVIEIERLMRYDKENDKLIPTNAIKIVIKGDHSLGT